MLYDFGTTTMTEFGCTSELHAVFTVNPYYTSQGITVIPVYRTIPITVAVTTAPSPVSTPSPVSPTTTAPPSTPSPAAKTNVGAIAGGVVGGLAVIGAVVFGVVFLVLRNRRHKHNTDSAAAAGHGVPTTTDYKPQPPPQSPPQQYPTQEQQPLMQPGDTASFYQPDAAAAPDSLPPKHEYANVQAQPVGYAAVPTTTELPSPSLSPAPQYTPPVPPQRSRLSSYPPPQQYQYAPVADHVAEVEGASRPYNPRAGGQAHELA